VPTTRTPSVVRSIVTLIVVKDEELFFQAQCDDKVPTNSARVRGLSVSWLCSPYAV
jgi:hypothetical protein